MKRHLYQGDWPEVYPALVASISPRMALRAAIERLKDELYIQRNAPSDVRSSIGKRLGRLCTLEYHYGKRDPVARLPARYYRRKK